MSIQDSSMLNDLLGFVTRIFIGRLCTEWYGYALAIFVFSHRADYQIIFQFAAGGRFLFHFF
jgi:hypothetical protein